MRVRLRVPGLSCNDGSFLHPHNIGLGSSCSHALVAGIARSGRGTAHYATSGSDLAATTMTCLKNSLQPSMTGTLDAGQNNEIMSSNLSRGGTPAPVLYLASAALLGLVLRCFLPLSCPVVLPCAVFLLLHYKEGSNTIIHYNRCQYRLELAVCGRRIAKPTDTHPCHIRCYFFCGVLPTVT